KSLLDEELAAGRLDLLHRIGNAEAKQPGRVMQALGVFTQLENLAAIGTLALEYGAGIVQAMGQDMYLRVRPGYEFAIHPYIAVKFVEWDRCHEIPPSGRRPRIIFS